MNIYMMAQFMTGSHVPKVVWKLVPSCVIIHHSKNVCTAETIWSDFLVPPYKNMVWLRKRSES